VRFQFKEKPTLGGKTIMNALTLVRVLVLVTLLVSLAGIPLYGQAQQPSSEDPAAQSQTQDPAARSQTSMSQQSQESQPPQLFVGKIARVKGKLVLQDDAGASYKLDNAEQAKQFVGKSVKVTGTLDTATKTINVVNIEASSS
jgi:hypothetical protein